MKYLHTLFLILLVATSAFGESTEYRKKNTATILCGTFLDKTTVQAITAGAGTVTCTYASSTDVANELAMASLPSAVAIGAVGQFCVPVTNTILNIDGRVRIYCTSSVANSASFEQKFTTLRPGLPDGSIGPLTTTFDGQTLAEGINTLDLELSEISIDGQFVGDKIQLYHQATGTYYGSSCILTSQVTNNRILTEAELSGLHTVGDYYIISPDAGCAITNSKLQSTAVAEITQDIFAHMIAELSAPPSSGTVSFSDILRAIFQRNTYKIEDNKNTTRRNWYKFDGTTVLGHQNIPVTGNVATTGGLVP